jgi:uncharacterized protein YcbK (DUF882 family)
MRSRVASTLLLVAIPAIPAIPVLAHADVQHVVARGHTVEAIANRYHVTAKAVLEANKLKDAKHLHPGDVLTIPTKDAPATTKAKADTEKTAKKPDAKQDKPTRTAKLEKASTRETTNFAMKPKTPGVLHVKRVATNEEYDVKVGDRRGRIAPTTLKTFEKMMRSPSGMAHPIEPRLVSLLSVMSNHFGSRKIEVVSGFRPFTPTQYNPHSNHMHGKAVDFRVVGVPNEVVRDFCRTLKNTGCGYYPHSVFVHMDVRDQSAFWIDYSKPGEAPRYNAPNTNADEGTSDVHDEVHPATGATPTDAAKSDDAPAVEEPKVAPPKTETPEATAN